MIVSPAMYCWGALVVCVYLSHSAMAFPTADPEKGVLQRELAAWVPSTFAKTMVLAATNVVPRSFLPREFVCSVPRAGPTTLASARNAYLHGIEANLFGNLSRYSKEVFDAVQCALF